MLPPAENIVHYRYIATAVLRVSGLVLLLVSAAPLVSWLAEGIIDMDIFSYGYYAGRILSGCSFAIIGLLFLLFAGPIVRLVFPFPSRRCPRCAYSLVLHNRPYCPECGLLLPKSLLEPSEASEVPQPPTQSGPPAPPPT